MAIREGGKGFGRESPKVDPTVERPNGVSDDVWSIYRTAKTLTPYALMLVGWSIFWLVTLRLLFVQERFLEFAVSAGLMVLPIVGLLGWMTWKVRHTEASRR